MMLYYVFASSQWLSIRPCYVLWGHHHYVGIAPLMCSYHAYRPVFAHGGKHLDPIVVAEQTSANSIFLFAP